MSRLASWRQSVGEVGSLVSRHIATYTSSLGFLRCHKEKRETLRLRINDAAEGLPETNVVGAPHIDHVESVTDRFVRSHVPFKQKKG